MAMSYQSDENSPEFLKGIFQTLGHEIDILIVLILIGLDSADVGIKGQESRLAG